MGEMVTPRSPERAILWSQNIEFLVDTNLKVLLKPCKLKVVAMHKSQSVAKDSSQVIDVEQSSAGNVSRRRDSVKIDSHPARDLSKDESDSRKIDPTRYGDWERNGRCIDF